MLWCFAQVVCNAILQKLQGAVNTTHEEKAPAGLKGLTHDIAFSPLEEKTTTWVLAAQADFAEVNLAAWSLPSDRGFAHKNLMREKIKSHEIPKIGLSVIAKNSSLVLLQIF
jgi:hypothetical protein